MRTSDRRGRSTGSRALAGVAALACLLAACTTAAAPTPAPTPVRTPFPFPTPWAHMTAPARADDVYLALLADRLTIMPSGATSGGSKDPVKRIQATYEHWPLFIAEYKSAKTLDAVTSWKTGAKPGKGEAPIEFIGLNIIVGWGLISADVPTAALDARQLAAAAAMRDKLDRLLSPLKVRTTVALPAATASSAPATSAPPSAKASTAP